MTHLRSFHPPRFFRFVTLLIALSGLALIGAAQHMNRGNFSHE